MKVFIYCLFDENGIPFYIGKTKNPLKKRESQHQKRLQKDLTIFELDFIEEKEWVFWECYWIEQFKCWGLNLDNKNTGGGGPSFHSEETKTKMRNTPRPDTSKKLKGKKRPDVSKRMKDSIFTPETCNKISEAKKGHECYNKDRTEKIKQSNKKHYKQNSNRNQKISSKLKGRKCPWVLGRGKEIVQLDEEYNFINGYSSIKEASIYLNKPSSSISECCNKKRKSSYGYIWMFKEEYVNLKKNER
jgi:hypothetical protein